MMNQFVRKLSNIPLPNGNVSQAICHFDVETFEPEQYSIYRFDYPNQMVNAVKKRQAEFLAGRFAARLALTPLGYAGFNVEIGDKRQPIWPNSLVGAITHSDQYAACVVADKQDFSGIGIDIENVISNETMENIQKQIVNDEELYLIETASASNSVLFTAVFSAKESFFKAAFPIVQEYFDFDALRLTHIDNDSLQLCFRVAQPLHGIAIQSVVKVLVHRLDEHSLLTFTTM